MKCQVYRSNTKLDTYLYMLEETTLDKLPNGLTKLLGRLEPVMQLDLSECTTLANADIEQVIDSLNMQGYYLQMPRKYHTRD